MRLYEIDDAIRDAIAEGVDEETGEITPEALEALAKLDMEREVKLGSYACVIRELEADAAAIEAAAKVAEAEAEKIRKRANEPLRRAKQLRDVLRDALGEGNQLPGERRVRVSWGAVPRRVELDVQIDALPQQFLRVTRAPDKAALKAALTTAIGAEREAAEAVAHIEAGARPLIVK